MKPGWLALLGAVIALLGIASMTEVADAQVRCGRFGCYTPSQASQYGARAAQSQRAAPIRRAAVDRRANWRAALRERQRAARVAARRPAAAVVARRPQVVPAAAVAAGAAAAAGAGIPVTELDVTKVPALSRDGVRRVQQALKDKGFDPGPVNGVTGARLKDAVNAFQARYGIGSNGEVDNQTLLALGEAELASQSNR
jgi:murein L,D-transpeptidase YcbB/YkuD